MSACVAITPHGRRFARSTQEREQERFARSAAALARASLEAERRLANALATAATDRGAADATVSARSHGSSSPHLRVLPTAAALRTRTAATAARISS
jgi:hypothetical protein